MRPCCILGLPKTLHRNILGVLNSGGCWSKTTAVCRLLVWYEMRHRALDAGMQTGTCAEKVASTAVKAKKGRGCTLVMALIPSSPERVPLTSVRLQFKAQKVL